MPDSSEPRLPGGARLIALPAFADPRGSIVIAESGAALPFVPLRVRWIHDVAPGAMRGGHAHRHTEQLFVAVHGRCTAFLTDGHREARVAFDRPHAALYVPPWTWVELSDFSSGAVALLLSSTVFEEADYVRERGELSKARR